MASFGQQYINNTYSQETLRDYTHASTFFLANSYEFVPRVKFLFHVYFNLNTDPRTGIPALQQVFGINQSAIGMLVKTFQLPQYKVATDIMNQYNRKRLVQKKIEYEPIQVVMHDDGGDLTRTLWYNYFSYYYKDPTQPYGNVPSVTGAAGVDSARAAGFDYNYRDIYINERAINDWGYIGESFNDGTNATTGKPPFFRDITIYGFNQHKWISYVLINPLITAWSHDTYDYSQDGGIMQNTMTIQYETVKYYTGAVGDERSDINIQGFAAPGSYDQQISPLSTVEQRSQVNGQGGSVQVRQGEIADLQAQTTSGVVGGVNQADVAYNNRLLPPQSEVIINRGGKTADPPIIDGVVLPPRGDPQLSGGFALPGTAPEFSGGLAPPLENPNLTKSVANGTPANIGTQIPTPQAGFVNSAGGAATGIIRPRRSVTGRLGG